MSDPCPPHVEGGGCTAPRTPRTCDAEPTVAVCDSGDCETDDDPVSGVAHLEGGGATACASVPAPPSVALVLCGLLWCLLRRARGAGLVLGLTAAATADAVDVEAFETLDGGPVPGMVDPALRTPWSSRLGIGGTAAFAPVRIRYTDSSTETLIARLHSGQVAFSLQVVDWFVVGAGQSAHHGVPQGDAGAGGPGDTSAFLRVPVPTAGAWDAAVAIRGQISTGRRSPAGAATAWTRANALSVGWLAAKRVPGPCGTEECGWWFGSRLAARLQIVERLPGLKWTSRWEWSVGVRKHLGVAGLGASMHGSAPLWVFADATAGWPVEAHGFGALALGPRVDLQVGGGAGLTRGLGAPEARGFAAMTWDGQYRDGDGDGLGDVRDLCPRRPEDPDGFRDGDGCPDPDNDRDGFLDLHDPCPDAAEVVNGLDDDDGCPDAMAEWTVEVRGDDLQRFWLELDGAGRWEVEPSTRLTVPPGLHTVAAEAPGHLPVRRAVELDPGANHTVITLRREQMGAVLVRLVSAADGSALAGTVALGDTAHAVEVGGLALPLPVGRHGVVARAPGHLPEATRLTVPLDTAGFAEIRLEVPPEAEQVAAVDFQSGSARLLPEAVDALDALAAWLTAHPEVRLLQIEGHADDVGTSADNLALSERRAAAVAEALAARGVARTRLRASGLGEAAQRLEVDPATQHVDLTVAGVAERQVRFRVLVWDDPP